MKRLFLKKGVVIGFGGVLLISSLLFFLFFDAFYESTFRLMQGGIS